MDTLVALYILELCDLEDLASLVRVSRHLHSLWNEYKENICKIHLDRRRVKYDDPTSFTSLKGTKGLSKFDTFKVYLGYYHYNTIDCSKQGITSFPIYPNMEALYACGNLLTHLPTQPSMTYCDVSNNRLVTIDTQPLMKNLYANVNLLTHLPTQPRMFYCGVPNNRLTTIDTQPLMNYLVANNNLLTHLPIQPSMTACNVENNSVSGTMIR